jgi:predicted O-methyltransferase YrrM
MTSREIRSRVISALKLAFDPQGEDAKRLRDIVRLQQELASSSEYLEGDVNFKEINRARFWEREGEAVPRTFVDRVAISRLATLAAIDTTAGAILYGLIRVFRPTFCAEIGTGIGISGCYIVSALEANGVGELVTLEGSPPRAELARDNFGRLAPGRARCVVGPFDETVPATFGRMERVDFAFIDDEHFEPPIWRDIKAIVPRLASPGVIVFDDIDYNEQMRNVWRDVCALSECAYACVPVRRGRPMRIGIWVKGKREDTYQGAPEEILVGAVWSHKLYKVLRQLRNLGRALTLSVCISQVLG